MIYSLENLLKDLESCNVEIKDSCTKTTQAKPVYFDFGYLVPFQIGIVKKGKSEYIGFPIISFTGTISYSSSVFVLLNKIKEFYHQHFVLSEEGESVFLKGKDVFSDNQIMIGESVNFPLVGSKLIGIKELEDKVVLITKTILLKDE